MCPPPQSRNRRLDTNIASEFMCPEPMGDEAVRPSERDLEEEVTHRRNKRNLAEIARSLFGPDNGVELELPPRGPMREPPSFD